MTYNLRRRFPLWFDSTHDRILAVSAAPHVRTGAEHQRLSSRRDAAGEQRSAGAADDRSSITAVGGVHPNAALSGRISGSGAAFCASRISLD